MLVTGLSFRLLQQRDGDQQSKSKPSYLPNRDTGHSSLCSVLKWLVRSIQRPQDYLRFPLPSPIDFNNRADWIRWQNVNARGPSLRP